MLQRPARAGVLPDWLREPRAAAARVDHHVGGAPRHAGLHDEPQVRLPQAAGPGPAQSGGRGEGISESLPREQQLSAAHGPGQDVRLTRGLAHHHILSQTGEYKNILKYNAMK